MGRIEQSKESIRNSVVVDADGSNEVNLVTLTPKNWATLCRKKEEGWFERNGHYSLEQLQAEIERLERLQTSYVAMGEAMGFTITLNPKLSVTGPDTTKIKYPVADPGGSPSTKPADDAAKAAFKATYEAQGALADAERKLRQNTDKSQDQKHKDDVKAKEAALNEKRKELANKTAAQQDAHSEYAKWAISTMNDQDSKDAARKWLERTINGLVTNIKHLKALGKDKLDSKIPSAIANTTAKDEKNPEGVNGTVNAVDEDNKPRAMFLSKAPESKLSTTPPGNPKMAGNDPRPQGGSSDPWTTISASFSASDQTSTANTSSWGMSVGGTVGWGGFSAGGSYAHEQSKSDFTADMASCDVSVSFSCLVVNIGRPWLYGEVFADSELDTAAGINLSPGARELKDWMAKQKGDDPDPQKYDEKCIDELQKYSMFPAYPTSFIVAADTTIEFHGNTQHMEKHFSAQSNSGSVSVGWGPFSVNSSFHQSSSKQSFQLQSTATGCRLSFGAPQVIGWVSQILPMLPRPTGYEPMLQRDGTKTA
ncbi:hypothetical protein BDV25DRAFT_139419 [Aspergillus avenaceus]|uniref:Uncharacterized protein n=1 Tax=Aspergillus avenaceus TaxID=36643 RepID=A0A5N6TWQ9_ASPAV|nr:hypothetical protein BDV25DRAFT_139419 [Aspergillus avenaceus]